MSAYILMNVIALCSVNILFLLLGSFLNATVIICLWKSSHLRKKFMGHFMILVLSCFDLAIVLVVHPLNVVSTIAWYSENAVMMHKLRNSKHVTTVLFALSFYALMTMNLERYIAVKYPIYHKISLTKSKLLVVFAIFFLLAITLRVFSATGLIPQQLPSSLTFLVILPIMLLTNFRMHFIARRTLQKKAQDRWIKMRNKKEVSQNSDKIQDKSDKIQDKSDKLQEKSDKLSEKSDKLQEKSNKLHQKSDNLSEESNKLHQKSDNLSEKSDKLSEKSNKLHQETDNLSEKNDNFQEKRRKRQNKRPKLSLQSVSTCILAVTCFTLCALPGMVFNGLNILMGKERFGKDNFQLIVFWVGTLLTLNSSFNSLVFFWKNPMLREEGQQLLRKLR